MDPLFSSNVPIIFPGIEYNIQFIFPTSPTVIHFILIICHSDTRTTIFPLVSHSLALSLSRTHTHTYSLSLSLSIYLSIYLSVCLSVCLSLSFSLSLSLSLSLSPFLSPFFTYVTKNTRDYTDENFRFVNSLASRLL